MHIIYAVTTCSDRVYRQLFEDAPGSPPFSPRNITACSLKGLPPGQRWTWWRTRR